MMDIRFKASFFIACGRVGTQPYWMNWQAIAVLKKDGMDIESHTMKHAHLNKLSTNALTYEVGGSRQCLAIHGINSTNFGPPIQYRIIHAIGSPIIDNECFYFSKSSFPAYF